MTPRDIIDGLNNHNMGTVRKQKRYTFDLTMFPHGKAFDLMNKIQDGERYFDLVLAPAEFFDAADKAAGVGQPTGAVWTIGKAVFQGAWIEDSSHRFNVGGEPAVTYTCKSLRYVFDQNQDGQGVYVILGNGLVGASSTDSELKMNPSELRDVGGNA